MKVFTQTDNPLKPPEASQIFQRVEKKYLLEPEQVEALRQCLRNRLQPDAYGKSAVCSIYFDTDDFRLIRRSLEKPLYKEKLRLRSYGAVQPESTVFLELKKKFKGVVYKRREKMAWQQAKAWLQDEHRLLNTQILREIDWQFHQYPGLKPAAFIGCRRQAFCCPDEPELRLTFDRELVFRQDDLTLTKDMHGQPLLRSGQVLMEIKTLGAMPLWLAEALDTCSIYPRSFSKYGFAYQNYICTGGFPCSTLSSNQFSPIALPSATICSVH